MNLSVAPFAVYHVRKWPVDLVLDFIVRDEYSDFGISIVTKDGIKPKYGIDLSLNYLL